MTNKEEEIKELAKVLCREIILNKGQNYCIGCAECLFQNENEIGCLWLAKSLVENGYRKQEYVEKETSKIILGAYYKTAKECADNKITLSVEGIKCMGHDVYGIEVDV